VRGKPEQQLAMLTSLSTEDLISADHPIRKIRRIVDEVLSATYRRCPIDLSVASVEGELLGDERLLSHIFTNLLSNAAKYSSAGSPVTFAVQPEHDQVVFTIRDKGIGITSADQKWLFTAFHRGRNVGDRPGTGLPARVICDHGAKNVLGRPSCPAGGGRLTLTAASLWFGLLSSLSIERRTCLPKSPRRPTRRALPRAGTH